MSNYRQEYGEGSLRKRADGNWEARYYYTDAETGKRERKSVYAPTQAKAKEKLRELKNRLENPPDPKETERDKLRNLTLGEWLDLWMREYKKNSIRATTYTNYHLAIENHIRPELGRMKIQDIRPEHVQKLSNDIAKRNPQTIAASEFHGAFERT